MRKEFDNPEIKSTYQSWLDMKGRCFNEKSQRFYTHGARGITVCDEWKYNFDAFVKDMGVKPSLEFSIERIDNDGNYCKDNCKWATAKEQGANRRTNIYVEYNGETKTVAQWADQLGISHSAFTKRLANWPDMDEVMYQGRATKSTFPKPKKEIINE